MLNYQGGYICLWRKNYSGNKACSRTYPDIDRREGGSFTRAEARNEDAGAAMKALRQGRMTQPQAEEMTSLPTSNIGIGSKGSLLITALWMLFFLALLAAAVAAHIKPQINTAAMLLNRQKAYFIAEAGVQKAIAVIKKDSLDVQGSGYDALNEIWNNNEEVFKDIHLGEGVFNVINNEGGLGGVPRIKYGLIDEERKININKASREELIRFFEISAGLSAQSAASIADSIIDWRDGDDILSPDGAETGYYTAVNAGYPCKNKNFGLIEELLLIKGLTQDIFDKVKGSVTVFGSGAVNINTADEVILRSIGLSESLTEKIIRFRRGNDNMEATEDDNIFESSQSIIAVLTAGPGLSTEEIEQVNNMLADNKFCARSDNFSGKSIGGINDKYSDINVIFVFNRDNSIKYWRQN